MKSKAAFYFLLNFIQLGVEFIGDFPGHAIYFAVHVLAHVFKLGKNIIGHFPELVAMLTEKCLIENVLLDLGPGLLHFLPQLVLVDIRIHDLITDILQFIEK